MPVTVQLAQSGVGTNTTDTASSTKKLYNMSNKTLDEWHFLQSSFGGLDRPLGNGVTPFHNGFVNGILHAVEMYHHLDLRPDDIWLAISVQFSFFSKGNADFTKHNDQVFPESPKTARDRWLSLMPFSVSTFNVSKAAKDITHSMPEDGLMYNHFREWAVPRFSTATDDYLRANDDYEGITSIVLMGAVQNYFKYAVRGNLEGGSQDSVAIIKDDFVWPQPETPSNPSVTLLGDRSDWVDILDRVKDMEGKWGDQIRQWQKLLVPIIEGMIATFDDPGATTTSNFWRKACQIVRYKGQIKITGWLTAFCFFTVEGNRATAFETPGQGITLGDVGFAVLSPKDIPEGVMSVPVMIRDYALGMEYSATLIAGHIGMSPTALGTKFYPRAGWWLIRRSADTPLNPSRRYSDSDKAATS